MKLIKNEQLDKNVVKLTIEIDKEAFEAAMTKSFKKNVKYINIPGFRKGKAPRHLVEKYYGEAVFYEDAINFVCPDAYEFAVKEAGIEPVDRPEIDIESIGDGKETVITAVVTVKPEVTLGEYKGIKVEKTVYETKDEDIDREIKAAQEQNSRMIPVEDRAVKMGDSTVIDFEGFVDGVAFEGGKGEDYTLVIGSGSFIPGFEDALVGAQIGTETDVNVTFPEEYHSEELKGKDATFKVTVKSITEKELPELDDDFAKDVSEFETFEEYKNSIKEKLDKANADRTKAEFENAVLEVVTKNTTVEIPDCMIEQRLEDMLRDFDYRLSMQGMKLDQYMQMTGLTVDGFKEQFKDQATEQVKMNLALEEIVKIENIEVTDSIRSYVEEKISKLEKYFTENQELTAHVNLKVYAEKTSKVEVTIPAKNITLRAEDTSQELYGSIDLVQEKLERQIRKYKTKVQKKRSNIATGKVFETFVELSAEEEIDEQNVEIVRTKNIDLKPMDAEEAVLQMELVDHDFFIFNDAETNATSIVYRREDGNIGLIETK